MTNEEIFKERQEAHRLFLRHFTRKELLALRQDVDEAIGYREFVQKMRDHGIRVES